VGFFVFRTDFSSDEGRDCPLGEVDPGCVSKLKRQRPQQRALLPDDNALFRRGKTPTCCPRV